MACSRQPPGTEIRLPGGCRGSRRAGGRMLVCWLAGHAWFTGHRQFTADVGRALG